MVRETVYLALFNKLTVIDGIITTGRRLKNWADVPAAEQPALFQAQMGETITQTKGLPPKVLMNVELYVYAYSDDDSVPPASILNQLIDSIEAALAPDPATGFQTLGLANVSHCWIEGRIETDEGTLGPQSVAIIPVSILTA